ncbi:universal stress protein [Thalassiella azotivora]
MSTTSSGTRPAAAPAQHRATDPVPDYPSAPERGALLAAPRPAPGTGRVVVGDDRTHHSRRAVEFAVREAELRGEALTLLTVVTQPFDASREVAAQRREHGELLAQARAHVDAVAHGLRTTHPRLRVDAVVLVDPRPADLAALLEGTGLLVVGARGAHGPRAFGLESTSRSILGRVGVPVTVVPDDGHEPAEPADQPVVVAGVPDGPLGVEVLRHAAAEARLRDGRLRVVHSFAPETSGGRDLAAARSVVSHALRAAGTDPCLPVSRILTSEPAAAAIARHADGADLVVVGSRGRLALAGLTSDSVSRSVLDAAGCPVQVVLAGDPG